MAHSGRLDMRELGRRGGLVKPETQLRKAVKEDDELRDQARDTLRRALSGEDVPKPALDAARSLFAFRPASPPQDREDQGEGGVHLASGKRATSLGDVLDLATELGALEMLAPAFERAHARLMEQRQNGEGKAA